MPPTSRNCFGFKFDPSRVVVGGGYERKRASGSPRLEPEHSAGLRAEKKSRSRRNGAPDLPAVYRLVGPSLKRHDLRFQRVVAARQILTLDADICDSLLAYRLELQIVGV